MKIFILIIVFLLAGITPALAWEYGNSDWDKQHRSMEESRERNERMKQEFDNHRMEDQLGRQQQQLNQMEFQRNLDNMFPDQKGGSNCLQKPYNIHRNRLKTLDW